MQKRISFYDVDWDRRKASGSVALAFDDRSTTDLRPLAAEELGVLANILRSNKPVYYDPETETFSTQTDPVGE
ncbi:MAG: hypothetical protein OEM05_18085 [Myxococcales bacterium]|nr:hypothetical protein [Myxococcales bacterium]